MGERGGTDIGGRRRSSVDHCHSTRGKGQESPSLEPSRRYLFVALRTFDLSGVHVAYIGLHRENVIALLYNQISGKTHLSSQASKEPTGMCLY
jgi:hypothetical protein